MPTCSTSSEVDLADGGNNMGTVIDSAISSEQQDRQRSEAPGGRGRRHHWHQLDRFPAFLNFNTTNGSWFGVFVSRNLDEDGNPDRPKTRSKDAHSKVREMMQLIYSTGAEKVAAGEKVNPNDRRRYNEAAELPGRCPAPGEISITPWIECPECGEDIRKGAKVCKHCQLAIDEASVAARAKKRPARCREVAQGNAAAEVGE